MHNKAAVEKPSSNLKEQQYKLVRKSELLNTIDNLRICKLYFILFVRMFECFSFSTSYLNQSYKMVSNDYII